MYKFTEKGLEKVHSFIAECEAKRKEILDAGKDTTLNELKEQIQKEENEKNLILGIMPHLKENDLGGITYPTI